jgi:hypothetical protein
VRAGDRHVTRGIHTSNPWLEIPLDEYERHMSLPSIGQAQMLADQLAHLIARYRPASVGIVGCAGGNGLDRIETWSVERVVAVDVNPRYVEASRARHARRLTCLDLYCADVQTGSLQFEPVDLMYAALLFEYVDVPSILATIKRNCRSGGILATVLQLPSRDQHPVSASPYRSLNSLAPIIKLIAPADLCGYAETAGFTAVYSEIITLASGKQFWLQAFRL